MDAAERIEFIKSKIEDDACHNGFYSATGEELRWLIEQAERVEGYKLALYQIIYYCERDAPIPAEKVAREALES